ncbi:MULTISPECIES: LLM class flavin-dependent oxidoreductase [Nocardioides]|uniref:LLM class flavin-dependent oxidoreductase n=1 Tax=Nocardioides TaxID=1839 RepID=UPI00203D02F2|nr:LLM class flavin-dependent oxidoreductase [Nocardioides sp. P86]MCM3516523.1 LLM class flavin-dependent oxidoreductase [Nocardioides sp. P86]
MRFGLTILPELPWAQLRPRWEAAEAMGFDHAWTYDHLVWGGLPESPWYGTTPTLTAAALVTARIGLGTFVSSPNFRHPVALHRDVQSLDDVSGGRFLLGVGTGGDLDSRILGGEELSTRERVDRFQEFVELLVRLRTEDHVDADGRWFSARDARTLPPLRDVPLVVAANGPRSLRFAARTGDAWVTTGPRVDTLDAWFDGLDQARRTLEEALVEHGRDPAEVPRYLNLDSAPQFSLESAGVFTDMTGRAAELGFTDVITHWPRPDGPYAGDEAVLEQVAADVLPALRG